MKKLIFNFCTSFHTRVTKDNKHCGHVVVGINPIFKNVS